MKVIYLLMVILWPGISGISQEEGDFAALKAGDPVPPLAFSGVINYPDSSIALADFRNKIVILDFWATWCGSCIRSFPAIDSLQTQLGSNVQFIMVYRPGPGRQEEASRFFSAWKQKSSRSFRLPLASAGPLVYSLFPHIFIPFYVVIGKDRQLLGLADSKEQLLALLASEITIPANETNSINRAPGQQALSAIRINH